MIKDNKLKRLHLGCGRITPPDWINIDSSWNAWLAKHLLLRKFIKVTGIINNDLLNITWGKNILLHDLTKKLPFNDNSIDYIYSSHTLEHLYLDQAKDLLDECFRVLKVSGVIRIIVPDLKLYISQYISGTSEEDNQWHTKADKFIDQLQLRPTSSTIGNLIFRFYNRLNDTSSHKWMYDLQSLTFYLKKAGFVNIKAKKLFESKIKGIKKIEQPVRLKNAVCLEAEK